MYRRFMGNRAELEFSAEQAGPSRDSNDLDPGPATASQKRRRRAVRTMATNKKNGKWRKRTQGVRGSTIRTPFQETSEALFLTSGYAYENAEEAEARFKGEIGGYQYSRYANPTVTMFEEKMAALEGSAVAQATATGMAAVSAALLSAVETGDHVVAAKAMFGSCLHVVTDILPRFGVTHTLVDGG